jgi:outer membrane protein
MTRPRSARRVLAATALVCAISGPASAQEGSAPRAMTLDEAIAFARAHQPRIRASRARIAAQSADAEVPRAQWLPLAGVTAQMFAASANNTTGAYVGRGVPDIPRIGGTRVTDTGSFRPYASTIVAAGVTQQLFDFGRIAAQAAAADARVAVEKERERTVELDVTFDVEEAYFAVFAAEAIMKAAEDAYDRARVHRDLAKAGVDAGLRSPIELTRAEAELAQFEIGRIRARAALVGAQTEFAAAVGVDDALLDVAGVPSSPPDMPALDRAIREAAARDPRLLEALEQLHAAEANTRAIGAELRPDLALTASLSGRAGGATPSGNGTPADGHGFLPNVPNWDAGVVFSWPLFDGTVRARADAARSLERADREEIALARHEQVAQIRLAYNEVDVARTALPGLQRSVDAALANYAQAEARFRSGLGTSVELADAEAVRTNAEIQLALGQFALARARAGFGRAIAE